MFEKVKKKYLDEQITLDQLMGVVYHAERNKNVDPFKDIEGFWVIRDKDKHGRWVWIKDEDWEAI